MTTSWFIAFVIAPALVVAVGWVAVVLHERDLARRDRPHHAPGE